ncbi:uncharacterized protein LOC110981563 isoform X3 [Acanthaster planci]|uniref:Uncharacterized protein LOC110981563 isoform X3 n=1 Tax=Acanthaster planci TaxID=133434 RepID=A0A8B7YR10_ACAPL|nr:uncharacterized protein LOC110981563 isoform X3 [Acanthaster planci]
MSQESQDCPSSIYQARSDSLFELLQPSWNVTSFHLDGGIAEKMVQSGGCFYRRFRRSGSPGSLCCYINPNTRTEGLRQFPDDVYYGSVVEEYSFNPFYLDNAELQTEYDKWIEKETKARYHCCVESSQPNLCEEYNNKRPSRNHLSYTHPKLAWCLGNGHFQTLDGANYTFNARGEYVLLSAEGFLHIFARMCYMAEAHVTNAAFFSAFNVQYKTSPTIEFRRENNTEIGFVVTRNGWERISDEQVIAGFMTDSCLVKNVTATVVRFSCPDGLSIDIAFEPGDVRCSLFIQLRDRDINSHFVGLLGENFYKGLGGTEKQMGSGTNGQLQDRDYFEFGQSWQLPVAVFSYGVDETFDTMNRPVSSSPPEDEEPRRVVQLRRDTVDKSMCGNSIVATFDCVAANNNFTGVPVKNKNEENFRMQRELGESGPVIDLQNNILEVQQDMPLPIQLKTTEPAAKTVKFSVYINDTVQQENIPNGENYTLNFSNSTKGKLTIFAEKTLENATVRSSVTPAIKFCPCTSTEEAYCDFKNLQNNSHIWVDKFTMVSVTLSCQNGGTLDSGKCNCLCAGNWEGKTCNECQIFCQHGGTFEGETCQCSCAGNWIGNTCNECAALSCQNGGIMDRTTCMCSCDGNWMGNTCDECQLSCENGGTLDRTTCMCSCAGNWMGNTCNECQLSCQNSGTLDRGTCMCSGCQLSCQNGGTLDEGTCMCSCAGNWMGNTCNECQLSCQNSGTLDRGTCTCSCNGNWMGNTCNECPLFCQNDGTLDGGTCTCSCDGNWMGNTCNECHLSCKNNGTFDRGTCMCSCAGNWMGNTCDDCSVSCPNGTANFDRCECVSSGNQSLLPLVSLAGLASGIAVLLIIVCCLAHFFSGRHLVGQKRNNLAGINLPSNWWGVADGRMGRMADALTDTPYMHQKVSSAIPFRVTGLEAQYFYDYPKAALHEEEAKTRSDQIVSRFQNSGMDLVF